MFKVQKLSNSLDKAIKTAEDILKHAVNKSPVKAKLVVKTASETFETNLIFLHKLKTKKIGLLAKEVKDKFPTGGLMEIQLHSTPIAMEGYKFYKLPKDLEHAVSVARDILMYSSRRKKIQAKLSVIKGEIRYDTSLIFLRKEDPNKVEQLQRELLRKFPDTQFDKILLLTSPIKIPKVRCSKCSTEMESKDLPDHLSICIKHQRCPVCQKHVNVDLEDHIDKCGVKVYNCNVCGEQFNTGSKRTSHQRKCGIDDTDKVAIGGLFRIVKLQPSISSPDYEGVLEGEVDHMVDILDNRIEIGLKFYISLEVNMKLPSDELTKVINFQSSATILIQETQIKKEVQEHIRDIILKIERYMKNGSGWLVENVKTIHLMITKYNPMGGAYIPLPKTIARKRSLLNIKNGDEKCLLWCLLAAHHPEVTINSSLASSICARRTSLKIMICDLF